ncbi:hypothetical protein PGT21_029585 [Puccinia graminis f. sp. tritici]|uniref:Uncharacterized protein n=1 Tax=Puccinia graminis f. sp. tritici TaxID=56615 RepID=A0A5B0NS03_PUCGR|nr:hypothetical protein PGT21_029585 [Puccinia graminis f. sp. tritici]
MAVGKENRVERSLVVVCMTVTSARVGQSARLGPESDLTMTSSFLHLRASQPHSVCILMVLACAARGGEGRRSANSVGSENTPQQPPRLQQTATPMFL